MPVTISIGVACSSQSFTDIESIVAAADEALYTAKRNGRNRVVAFGDNGLKRARAG